ncbi:hypothetical protein ACV1DR_23040, partial [Aeromonas jandaei]
DAINAGRKKVIGMMLLADRHDVISHFLHGDKAGASFALQHRVGFSHFQSTLYECINVMTVVENTTNSTIKKKQHNI